MTLYFKMYNSALRSTSSSNDSEEADSPPISRVTKLACVSKTASLVLPALTATLLLVALAIAMETRLDRRFIVDVALDCLPSPSRSVDLRRVCAVVKRLVDSRLDRRAKRQPAQSVSRFDPLIYDA